MVSPSARAQLLTGYSQTEVQDRKDGALSPPVASGAASSRLTGYGSGPISSGSAPVVARRSPLTSPSGSVPQRRLTPEPASVVIAPMNEPAVSVIPVVHEVDRSKPKPVVVASGAARSGFLTRPVAGQAVSGQGGSSAGASSGDNAAPVDFQADRLDYDEERRIIVATGHVVIEQEGRTLTADKVRHDLPSDTVRASGHVVLTEVNGDVHKADDVELRDAFKDGVVAHLKTLLADGSRFSAERGTRQGGVKTVMEHATYTACAPCEDDPEADPIWAIKASKVTHDKEAHRIAYNNAQFDVIGVPVAYFPYFSHSDGTVERESGFLAPSAGYKSDFGAFLHSRYYWDIAPDQDATVGVLAYTEENPLLDVEWRKRWDRASVKLEGGITSSERTDSEAGVDRLQDGEVRGHVLGNALWDIDRNWRAGADIQWASDDQYMRQYDFVNDDVLTSEAYVERFSDRDYFTTRVVSFQDTRVKNEREDQPDVLPEIVARFEGDPNAVPLVGGNWYVDSSFLGLRRDGDAQDMDRLSLTGGWQRRFVSDTGLLFNANLSARQDLYNIRDLDSAGAGSGQPTEATENRFLPQAHFVSSYPVARYVGNMQAVLEPIVSATFAPNIDVTNKIPNEDSKDVQIDVLNIFKSDRFPGLDRVEDQSRVTYGLRSGLYHHSLGELRTFLGQSYRLQKDDNPFPEGSGLTQRSSDIVGEIAAVYDDNYEVNYRFQLDSQNMSSRRHEVDGRAKIGRFSLGSRYLFAKSLEGTELDASREQLQSDIGYYLTKDWRTRTGFTQDFGDNPGLRKAYVGLDYFGQCLFLSLTGARNLTDDSSGESETEVVFRIGLKNLGEFEQSGWHTDK